MISLLGVASFLYPFFLPALAGVGERAGRGGVEVPLVFTALGVGCLLALLLVVQESAAGARGASRLVALLGVFGASTFAAALVPSVSLGFNWKRATARAANWAIGSSLVINLGIELLGLRLPWGIHGGVIAMIVSLLLFLGISLASSPPVLPRDVEAVLDA